MAPHAIIEKVLPYLATTPINECQVVYVLVELRKLMEHEGTKSHQPTLVFYCDWALHAKLDRAGARRILELLDERLGAYVPFRPASIDEDGEIQRIISFDLLRDNLRGFLEGHALPTLWTDDLESWRTMVRFYGEVVRDIPLVITRKDYDFRYLAEIVVTACDPPEDIAKANPDARYIGFQWKMKLDNGRTFTMAFASGIGAPSCLQFTM